MKIKLLHPNLFLVLVFTLSTSFTAFAQKHSLKAKIKDSSHKKVYLFVRDPTNRDKLLDSTVAVNDKFYFSQNLSELGFYTITLDKVPGGLYFIWDNNIAITGDSKTLSESQVKGSPSTAEWNKYYKTVVAPVRAQIIAQSEAFRNPSLDPAKRKELEQQQGDLIKSLDFQADKYILEHPQSFISLFLLNGRWLGLGDEKSELALRSLSPQLQLHSIAQAIRKEIKLNGSVRVGNPAPEFTAQDLLGNEFSLAKLKGKYVLLDFWGSWCGPCIQLMPETKEAFERYKDKDVQFLGIALDEEKDRPKLNKLIQRFELPWPQVFQDKSDKAKSQVVEKFVVTEFPSVILINPQGNIIYRGSGQKGLAEACKVLDKEI